MGPTTYVEKYQRDVNTLQGNYQALLAPFAANSDHDHAAALLGQVLAAREIVPKVFLGLVGEGGVYRTCTVHQVQAYPQHPAGPSHWDGQNLNFLGDVMLGNHISVRLFLQTAFNILAPFTVPTIAHTDALLAAGVGQDGLLPFAAGAANTELVSTWHMMQVPHAYVRLVLNRELTTPLELWAQLGGAI